MEDIGFSHNKRRDEKDGKDNGIQVECEVGRSFRSGVEYGSHEFYKERHYRYGYVITGKYVCEILVRKRFIRSDRSGLVVYDRLYNSVSITD